jgi:hypothetical protein
MGTRRGSRRRRTIVAGATGAAAVIGLALTAAADGGLSLTPSSGPPGTAYQVTVSCGDRPVVYRGFAQDDYVPGTIPPLPTDEVSEVAPSVWAADAVATDFDTPWWATCDGADAGNGRFDSERPHLWFGPRPTLFTLDPRTTVEGTDCPAGTTATVSITADGQTTTHQAAIDAYGDWTVALPSPVGSAELVIDASCGDVTYATLRATTTVPPTTPTAPPTTPPTTPTAPPATPQPGTAGFTG